MDANNRIICDMHSHILPGMDDGCKDTEMALEMLKQACDQDVDVMVCTPHYYPEESIQEFLDRRDIAIDQLNEILDEVDFPCPGFLWGAEVAYYPELVNQPDLHDLCITGTDYLLLEMPFHDWSWSVLRDIQRMKNILKIQPIIAHIERFQEFASDEQIDFLRNLRVPIQMNGEYILDKKTARKAKRMLKSGLIQLLGSDTHHPERRPQTMGEAFAQLDHWKLNELADEIADNSLDILNIRDWWD